MSSALNYVGYGLKPKKPTVLFIPGNLTSPAVYEGINVFLPCQSAVIDWCRSDGPWELDTIGKRVLQFIGEKDLGPTVLCGYSGGGVITMSAAIEDHENRIAGLVISNTGANAIGHGDPDFPQRIRAAWPNEDARHALLTDWFRNLFVRDCPRALYDILFDYSDSLNGEMAYRCTTSVRMVNLASRLGEITCPVLLAHGRFDTRRTEEHVRILREGIPNIEVEYLDGGHTIMVEDRIHYQDKLIAFVNRTIMG